MNDRTFSRARFRMSATVTTADRRFSGNVENLSMNGMFLVTPVRLGIGEPVEIMMLLDSGAPEITMRLHARVRRMDDNGLGFAFEKIDVDTFIHLKNIVSYNVKSSTVVTEEILRAIDERPVLE